MVKELALPFNVLCCHSSEHTRATWKSFFYHNSFVGVGIKFYNKLPPSFLDLPFNSFKTTVKAKTYYTVNDFLDDKNSWSLG